MIFFTTAEKVLIIQTIFIHFNHFYRKVQRANCEWRMQSRETWQANIRAEGTRDRWKEEGWRKWQNRKLHEELWEAEESSWKQTSLG